MYAKHKAPTIESISPLVFPITSRSGYEETDYLADRRNYLNLSIFDMIIFNESVVTNTSYCLCVESQFELLCWLHSQEMFSLVEFVDNLLSPLAGARIPIRVRLNDTLKSLRVRHRLYTLLVVAEEVIVKFNASRLFLLNHKLSNFQEELIDLGQLIVELSGQVSGTGALIGLQDNEELSDELLALLVQILFVEVDEEIVALLFQLKLHYVALLVLVQVHRQHIGALSVGLTPLFSLSIEQ